MIATTGQPERFGHTVAVPHLSFDVNRGVLTEDLSVPTGPASPRGALDAVQIVTPMRQRPLAAPQDAGAAARMESDGWIVATASSSEIGELANDPALIIHDLVGLMANDHPGRFTHEGSFHAPSRPWLPKPGSSAQSVDSCL